MPNLKHTIIRRLPALCGIIAALLTQDNLTGQDGAAGLNVKPKGLERNEQPSKSDEKSPEQQGWKSLIAKKGLEGWTVTDMYKHGEVKRDGDLIVMEAGEPMTGITTDLKEFPTSDYEIEMEARRVKGEDFLCGLTFPVGKGFASFIGGGWGGSLVGLSSVNGSDASENSTSSTFNFKNGQWYKFKVRVDDEFVRGFIDGKEVFAQERESNEFSTRVEVYSLQPLGTCAYRSKVEIKSFRWRSLKDASAKGSASPETAPLGNATPTEPSK
jgi:hypothetical protein